MSLKKLRAGLSRRGGEGVFAREWRGSIVLEGQAETWERWAELGWFAAGFGYKGVVNDIKTTGLDGKTLGDERLEPSVPAFDRPLEGLSFDVAIVGGGVVGAAIARELSKWSISVILLEKEHDVAVHSSSRNDGMIHDGFAAHPGTLKAKYNVRGNRAWEPLARDLGIAFARPGSLIVFRSPASKALYPVMAARAAENGVDGWELWSRKRVLAEEPNITDEQHGGFFLPSAGILSPYRATVALAESAAANGVRMALGTCVLGLDTEDARITRVRTSRGDFAARVVVNAAGNWADIVAGMANDRFFSLHQRRGTDMILDRNTGALQNLILGMPSLLQVREKTKGGGLVKTIEGNILVGPTAREAPGREDYATSQAEIRELERHIRVNRKLSSSMAITYFAGVRPCTWEEDFVVERSDYVRNLVHAAGIQSPGLASAPAIAQDVARYAIEALSESRPVEPNRRFELRLEPRPELRSLSLEERARIVAARPDYGRVVCRCEEVSEGEIRDAASGALPATSLDAVKRRTRAGMGRCHGGFCTPRVMTILAQELGVELCAITKKGPGSPIAARATKSVEKEDRDDPSGIA